MATLRNQEKQDRIARILLDAVISGDDQATADKYEVSLTSIKRWRKRVMDEGGRDSLALSQSVQQKLAALNVDWGNAANAAIVAGMNYLTRAATELPVSPEGIRAVAGSTKLVGELSAMNRTIEARLAKPATVTPLQGTASLRRAG